MSRETMAVVLLVAWAALAISWGYVSRELWTDPRKFWNRYRGRMAHGRARTRSPWLRILYLDVFDLENNEHRYVLSCRVYYIAVNIGILIPLVMFLLGLAR